MSNVLSIVSTTIDDIKLKYDDEGNRQWMLSSNTLALGTMKSATSGEEEDGDVVNKDDIDVAPYKEGNKNEALLTGSLSDYRASPETSPTTNRVVQHQEDVVNEDIGVALYKAGNNEALLTASLSDYKTTPETSPTNRIEQHVDDTAGVTLSQDPNMVKFAMDYDEEGQQLSAEPPLKFNSQFLLQGNGNEEDATEGNRQDKEQPQVSQFVDHFTLSIPSSTIRYRDSRSAARVVQGNDVQFVLEETYDFEKRKAKVEIRQIRDGTEGVQLLRIMYVIVTAFWTGFLFVFCLQILLFLMLDLSINLGITNKSEYDIGRAIGALFGFPPLVYGLASALVLAEAFIKDTWRGHLLIRNFALRNFGAVAVEWIFFAFFLGIPIFVMCIMLLIGDQDWWKASTLVWFSCVVFFYILFTVNVIGYEWSTCGLVMKNQYNYESTAWYHVLYRSILLRQCHTYFGKKTISYLAKGAIVDTEYTDKGSSHVNQIVDTIENNIGYLSKLTLWDKLGTKNGIGFYEDIRENEERLYSIDDARDVRPFMTSETWGLEKVFCRPHHSRYIAIVEGPGALTIHQLKSSMICSALGTFLIFFVAFSILLYMGLGAAGTAFGVAMGIIVAWPRIRSTLTLYRTSRDLLLMSKKPDPDPSTSPKDLTRSEGVYYVEEIYRISRPTELFCWIMFGVEFIAFFFYPLYSLFRSNNWPLGLLFLGLVGISGLRYYVNASVVLEEVGNMDFVGGSTESSRWKKQSRFNEIVGNITRNKSVGAWTAVLGFVGLAFMGLMFSAVGTDSTAVTNVPPKVYVYDFEWVQADSLRYPTCQLSSDLGDSPLTKMVDYAFLAGLAYYDVNNTQGELNGWFNGSGTDRDDIVQEYRQMQNTSSAVSFKLVTFPVTNTNKTFAYVLIRGTLNSWDMLTDAQLWSAAALMQAHRAILPMGFMWTPIIDQLLRVINKVESESIERVSFYKDTGKFVDYLKNYTGNENNDTYLGVAVTGHSLGGGLAMITGAQKGVPAVALSGPNAMLSRKSFDPPIKREALDKKTFNIIPERDIVPMIDDKAQNYQEIRCLADFQDVIGCHNSVRSLCEILYTCGSGRRPIPCACVDVYGYPEPTPKEAGTNTTFSQACAERQSAMESYATNVTASLSGTR